jgi:hypothetical protein
MWSGLTTRGGIAMTGKTNCPQADQPL